MSRGNSAGTTARGLLRTRLLGRRLLRLASSSVRRSAIFVSLVLLAAVLGLATSTTPTSGATTAITFAAIGDYGMGNSAETSVANLVKSWNPDFVIALGDDYYSPAAGSGDTKYDMSTGKDYCQYLAGIATSGASCPQPGPAAVNRFFPSLGNHDYTDAGVTANLPTTYTSYFSLPGVGVTSQNPTGNERYYDFVQGPVHFFVINSNNGSGQEPDGTSSTSAQATWLRNALAASTAPWQVVFFHHPPYSSGTTHGSSAWMQWPFAQWGADVVLAGHEHNYERILRDGIVYAVNGIGGASRYPCGTPITGSQFCYSANFGAQRVTASDASLTLDFITIDGVVRDTQTLTKATPTPLPTNTPTPTATSTPTATPSNTPTATPTSVPTATATSTSTPTPVATPISLTVAPSADAYVDATKKNVSYGTSAQLRAGGSPIVRSYLTFNVQGVSGTVVRATLWVYATSASPSGISARGLANPSATWSETTIRYSNAPAIAPTPVATSGAVASGTWVGLDVTSLVAGNGAKQMVLTTAGSTAISLVSREGGANAPRLVVEYR